ncbi:MAG: Uma2 family endonuclease [Candidatus Brocadia sp.]
MAAVTTGKRMTYDDYLKIDDNNRYEILNGELHMVPAPSTDHQGVSRNLEFLIWNFVKGKGLGKVFYAPVDVVFDDDEVFQPDIVFIKSERQGIISKNAIQGVPDLIVEIISPSSAFYDTVEKKEIYRKYGVKEYWLIFPEERVIEVLTLEKGEYLEFCKSKREGMVKSKILEGLEIDSKDVFD